MEYISYLFSVQPLNNTQKVLIIIAFIVFILVNIASLIIALPNFRDEAIREIFVKRPITATFKDNQNNDVTQKFNFGDSINLNSNLSQVAFNENIFVSGSPVSLKISENNEVQIDQGIIYIDVVNEFSVNLNKGKLTLNKGLKAIYNSKDGTIIVVSGSQNINKATVNPNELIIWEVDNYSKISFERSNFTSNADLVNLIAALKTLDKLPEELKNTTPPDIKDILPVNGSKTSEKSITLSGSTDSENKISINNKEATLNEGKFSIALNLEIGANTVNLLATDKYGNKKVIVLTYIREDNSALCDFDQLDAQLLCAINKYRTSLKIINFENDLKLEDIAYNHAVWMDKNKSTSHIETDGSSFGDRCAKQNVDCKAEINYAIVGLISAEDILSDLKKDEEFNKYLSTASYKKIGVGVYQGYLSILFN